MSRVCVKALSKTTTEKQLRDAFATKGEVTDVRIVRTKTGVSRQFGFVGFRSEVEAAAAIRYFNHTYLGTSRIIVEPALKLDTENAAVLAAARSKHSKKKLEKMIKEKEKAEGQAAAAMEEEEEEEAKKKEAEEAKGKGKKQPRSEADFADFLTIMKSRNAASTWGNDDSLGVAGAGAEAASASQKKKTKTSGRGKGDDEEEEDSGDDSDVNELPTGSRSALKKKSGNGDDSEDDEPFENEDDDDEDDSALRAKTKKPLSDMDFLRSKIKTAWKDSDDEGSQDGDSGSGSDSDEELSKGGAKKQQNKKASKKAVDEDGSDNEHDFDEDDEDRGFEEEEDFEKEHGQPQQKRDKKPAVGAKAGATEDESKKGVEGEEDDDTGRLFVRNLPFSTSEEDLRALFEPFGRLTEVHMPIDAEKRSKGFAFVQFMLPEAAASARSALDGSSFQGRLVHVITAKAPRESAPVAESLQAGREGKKLSSFQLKKEEERRKKINDKEGWNAAFVRSDAVVDSLAERYGVKRSDILDTSETAGEMAVRLAIGETQIVSENREYLASHGVDLAVLESSHSGRKASARSPTTLLVKNLPHDLVPEELESMFSKFGVLATFLVPKSKTLALVDFVEPTEARTAHKALAYRSYHKQPLYLEWAPLGIINRNKAAAAAAGAGGVDAGAGTKTAKNAKSSATLLAAHEDDGSDYSTLFVKNLSFATTEGALQETVLRLGLDGLRTVSIQKKRGGGGEQSMGFGFLEFCSAADAETARAKLDRYVIDGHALEVKPSNKRISAAPKAKGKGAGQAGDGAPKTNKLVVRNVPFQATANDLRSLFSALGALKSVRMPKKMHGQHRGFAFIEMATAAEAASARAALAAAHLYGRHLVIDWAQDGDETLEALQKRTADQAAVLQATRKKARLEDTSDDPMMAPDGMDDDEDYE